jgi:hypothetical protein
VTGNSINARKKELSVQTIYKIETPAKNGL